MPPTYPSMGPSPGFYNNFLHHNPWPQQHNQPPPPSEFPWATSNPSHFQHLQAESSQYTGQQASSSNPSQFMGMSFPYSDPLQRADIGQNASPPQPASPPGSTANSSEVDQSITEEKRRRNTAASARFRIKKKHKTITLERSVSDLTGRAEELEREVADLRRENGWLKEIVMLKGAQFQVGRSQQQTLNIETQASSSRETTHEVESSEQDSDTENQPVKKDKGKAADREDWRK
ncbi:hypothetical protein CPB83DRAFT_841811 [Crepidotus variabilis]|uniref:BZIP domain-containing protein n=1 Tax=Crepidotus variabilis TaxID=179855 RepID=A0A9P6JWU1_9AGAR|nr:hypothetical protein CPB83DRAFT_841811 [Crepidotus variabilis]